MFHKTLMDADAHELPRVGVPNSERALIRNTLVWNYEKIFFLLIDHDFWNFFTAVKKLDLSSKKRSITQFHADSAAAAAAALLQHNLALKKACKKIPSRILMLCAILPTNIRQIEMRWSQDTILAYCRKKSWKKLFSNV